jgi:hypothetical protein
MVAELLIWRSNTDLAGLALFMATNKLAQKSSRRSGSSPFVHSPGCAPSTVVDSMIVTGWCAWGRCRLFLSVNWNGS